jgi:hypothetical protein
MTGAYAGPGDFGVTSWTLSNASYKGKWQAAIAPYVAAAVDEGFPYIGGGYFPA